MARQPCRGRLLKYYFGLIFFPIILLSKSKNTNFAKSLQRQIKLIT